MKRMRPKNSDFENDPEFQQFQESIKDKSPSTAKSYKASYKKVRDLLGKCIQDTAEETVIKVIQVRARLNVPFADVPT